MAKIFQLKICLLGIEPLIWRRFLVEDSISFYDLHKIIQQVMGWENYHMYEFEAGKVRIEAGNETGGIDSMFTGFNSNQSKESKNAEETRLNELLTKKKQKFYYTYDFGDSWEHEIIVEDILEKDENKKYPLCIEGEMACPPEDCGGLWGYEELLEIQKDKNHPDYEERIVEWLGEDFDPEYFDIEEVNENLSSFKKQVHAKKKKNFKQTYMRFPKRKLGLKTNEPIPKKIGRNEPCPCGSGKKYKKCCLNL